MSEETYEGRCLCGAVRFKAASAPKWVLWFGLDGDLNWSRQHIREIAGLEMSGRCQRQCSTVGRPKETGVSQG